MLSLRESLVVAITEVRSLRRNSASIITEEESVREDLLTNMDMDEEIIE